MADKMLVYTIDTGGTTGVNLIDVPSGGGSSFTQAVVALPFPAQRYHSVSVTDAAVSPSSKIIISTAGVPETAENAGSDIDIISMQAVPGSGSFEFQVTFMTPFAGTLTINYAIGA